MDRFPRPGSAWTKVVLLLAACTSVSGGGGGGSAHAASPPKDPSLWMRFYEASRDGTTRLRSLFEVSQDFRAVWETTRRGGDCAPSGGRFSGKLTPSEARKLAELGFSALQGQSMRPASALLGAVEGESPARDLEVEFDRRRKAGSFWKHDAAVADFTRALALMRRQFQPESALQLTASREGTNRVKVTLQRLGSGKILIPIPSEAGDAFALLPLDVRGRESAPLRFRYVKPPLQSSLLLEDGRDSWTTTFELAKGSALPSQLNVRFSTQAVRHHAFLASQRALAASQVSGTQRSTPQKQFLKSATAFLGDLDVCQAL
jgi:hypothetical protein